ncbi:MAG: tRNA (guanosine(37)-N1)-methyltransferase TrmD [Alphaproteobacteria bacterium]
MKTIVLTLYPDMFPGTLGQSLAGKALENSLWSMDVINIRDFATDKHRTVDDTPYGGGAGMVLKPDIVHAAIEAAKAKLPGATLIYTSPRGERFSQSMAESFKDHDLIILCGRFEGVDQRVLDHHQAREVSLGDFVLSGGEIAAQAMLDACIRLLPGVMGNSRSGTEESFSCHAENGRPAGRPSPQPVSCDFQEKIAETEIDSACLLEYPHYTRPLNWNGMEVPAVLHSGNHEQIRRWRRSQAEQLTAARRPDLLKQKK